MNFWGEWTLVTNVYTHGVTLYVNGFMQYSDMYYGVTVKGTFGYVDCDMPCRMTDTGMLII